MSASPAATDPDSRIGRLRLVAIVSGLLGTLCFLALPFLPVSQTTATVQWPQNGSVNSVSAPLMAHSPQRVTATLPCALVGDLPADGGILVSTAPAGGEEAGERALFVRASADTVDVVSRSRLIASAPRDEVENGGCSQITLDASPTYVAAEFVGIDGSARRVDADDLRPMVVGVYSDLPSETAPDGLDVGAVELLKIRRIEARREEGRLLRGLGRFVDRRLRRHALRALVLDRDVHRRLLSEKLTS